jgi:preprotein translocase subunit SecD
MNRNPTWKYLLLALIVIPGLIYALPNLYGENPGVQIAGIRTAEVTEATLATVETVLSKSGLMPRNITFESNIIKVLFSDTEDQIKARELIADKLGNSYSVALALIPATPDWLSNLGAAPMYLGLDLRGGVHFLLQVDVEAALQRAQESYVEDFRTLLREERVRHLGVRRESNGDVSIKFRDEVERGKGFSIIINQYADLQLAEVEREGEPFLIASLTRARSDEIKKFALQQNITALRSRIDELGVSEPVIQQQGADRIVVQLPGVQDTARAKDILGRTATLEVMMVDEKNDLRASVRGGAAPPGSKLYYFRDGRSILLLKRLIYSGDNIVDASSGFDNQNGGAIVNISLDSKGSAINRRITGENIGNRMAILYVEDRQEVKTDAAGEPVLDKNGQEVMVKVRIEEVITAPVIRDQLGKRFQISGIGNSREAQDLALLLRAGSLATPVYIVEERTVGPSLGKDNIDKGFKSVLIGFIAVLLFMLVYYRVFGGVACTALMLNLVLIIAVLSLFQATLTLPGVAGMVLTVGMAVDANVLIFERIREELRAGNTPQASINSGYERAFSTIIDANVTTLIAALVLFNFGTGPIKGFAITLSIGILTSMFTAIFGTRVLVNFIYGGRRLDRLSI